MAFCAILLASGQNANRFNASMQKVEVWFQWCVTHTLCEGFYPAVFASSPLIPLILPKTELWLFSYCIQYLQCVLRFLSSVLWSPRPVRVHAEIPKHRFHSPLHSGVHPQDYCLRSTGELTRPNTVLTSARPANYLSLDCVSVYALERDSPSGHANQPEKSVYT